MSNLNPLDSTVSNDGASTVRLGAGLGSPGALAPLPDHGLWAQALADAGLDGGGVGSTAPGITVHASPAGASPAGPDGPSPRAAGAPQTAPAEPSMLGTAWNWTKQEVSGAMHAVGDFDAAHGHVLTRVAGGVQAVAGAAEALTGVGLAGLGGGATATGVGAAPGIPAMLAGGVLTLNGADNVQAGLRTAITGEAHHTLLANGAGAGARALGASDGTAEKIATGVDIAQSIVAGVGARAAGKAIAAAREAATTADAAPTVAGTIRNANPTKGDMNCVNCAATTDAILRGTPASALPGGPFQISTLEKYFGSKFGPATLQGIEDTLRAGGNNSTGIVFAYNPGQPVGHVFNAVNQGGIIRFLDGQIGNVANTSAWSRFQFMPLKPIGQ